MDPPEDPLVVCPFKSVAAVDLEACSRSPWCRKLAEWAPAWALVLVWARGCGRREWAAEAVVVRGWLQCQERTVRALLVFGFAVCCRVCCRALINIYRVPWHRSWLRRPADGHGRDAGHANGIQVVSSRVAVFGLTLCCVAVAACCTSVFCPAFCNCSLPCRVVFCCVQRSHAADPSWFCSRCRHA